MFAFVTRFFKFSTPVPLPVLFACAALVVFLSLNSVSAQEGGPEATNAAGPGSTDPQGPPINYTIFADHEVWAPFVLDIQLNGDSFTESGSEIQLPNASLEITSTSGVGFIGTDPSATYSQQWYFARGRITRQDVDEVVGLVRTGSSVVVELYTGVTDITATSATLPNLAPRANGFSDFMDVATGDLDKIADKGGNNHDEVVVAWASPAGDGYTINVEVLDFTTDASGTTQPIGTISATAPTGVQSLNGIVAIDTILDVAVADFDNNGLDEIAVTYLQNNTSYVVQTFRYTKNAQGTRALQAVNTTINTLDTGFVYQGSLSADVGDLEGDGTVDLVVSTSAVFAAGPTTYGNVDFFEGTNNLNLQTWGGDAPVQLQGQQAMRVQMVMGLFKFDPGNGYGFGRRQILMGWASGTDTLSVEPFDWSPGQGALIGIAPRQEFSPYFTDQRWSITAGAFRGVLAPEEPTWSAAFYGYNTQEDENPGYFYLYELQNEPGNPIPVAPGGTTTAGGLRLPVVAFDVDGNSLFVGAPVHITADGTITTDYVIYEPPKHTFYNIAAGNVWGYQGEIINISRFPDFNVTFTQANTSSVSTSSTQTSDWTIGGSASLSASATVSGGFDVGIAEASVDATTSMSATVGYNYSETSKTTDSQYQTSSIQYSTTTSADDSLGGSIQSMDIWRYRIFGPPSWITGQFPAGYYDYVIPSKQVLFEGNSGLDLDWYQPLHENGNLLSYPIANNNTYQPSDIGTVVVNGVTQPGTLVPATQITCCGNGGSSSLAFSGSVSQGSSFSSSNTLNESLDFNQSYSASAEFDGDGASVSAGVNLAFNNSNSWSKASTKNKTTTVTDSITLNYSTDGTGFGYFVYPVMHTTPDGTYKVSHAIDFLSSGQAAFWNDYYGQLPDPALNLPSRFYETTFSNNPYWAPQLDDSRKTIRGVTLLNGVKNPHTNQNDILPYEAPVAGAPLLFQVNVYNYSTGGVTNQIPTNANNLQVQLQYAPFNGTKETGPRVTVGTQTIPQVAPLQMVPVQIPWNTTGLGGNGLCATQQYRVIVTLDPNNNITEIYEAENPSGQYPYVFVNPLNQQPTTHVLDGIDPGQNNEGYAYVTIQTPDPNNNCDPGLQADISLRKKGFGAIDAVTAKLRTDHVTAIRNQPLRVRLKVHSDQPHVLYGHVFVYDGNPRKGGTLIADKLVHFGNPKGAIVWFDWIPHKRGEHVLYAVVNQRRGDPIKNNARTLLPVTVIGRAGQE